MPRVPVYGEQTGALPRVRQAGPENVRINVDAPIEAFGGGRAAQPIDLSGPQRLALEMQERERAKANQIVNLRTASHLRATATELQVGALSRKGTDAFAAQDEATEAWRKRVEELRGTLTNDVQRIVFEEAVNQHWGVLHENLLRHAVSEGRQVDSEGTESFITNTRRYGLENYRDSEVLARSLAEIGAARRSWGRRNGVSPERVKELEATDRSQFHVGIIARMHTNGEAAAAKDYFEAHRTEFVDNDLLETEKRVKTAFGDDMGIKAAGETWAKLGPKPGPEGLNTPVRISTMEDAVRKSLEGNQPAIKAAIAELRTRKEAHDEEQREVTASNIGAVMGAYNEGASLTQLKRMPAYLALTGKEQEDIVRHVVDRARNPAQPPTEAQWANFWNLTQPESLAMTSDRVILSWVPMLGQELVNEAMRKKRSLDKPEAVRGASIDADLFAVIAEEVGLQPKKKNQTQREQAELGQLRNAVEREIDLQQQAKGRTLTREEKATAMRSVVDQKVMLDIKGGKDLERFAGTLADGERNQAYTPKDQVDPDIWSRLTADLKAAAGKDVPQRTIERAAAAFLMGDVARYQDLLKEQQSMPATPVLR